MFYPIQGTKHQYDVGEKNPYSHIYFQFLLIEYGYITFPPLTLLTQLKMSKNIADNGTSLVLASLLCLVHVVYIGIFYSLQSFSKSCLIV